MANVFEALEQQVNEINEELITETKNEINEELVTETKNEIVEQSNTIDENKKTKKKSIKHEEKNKNSTFSLIGCTTPLETVKTFHRMENDYFDLIYERSIRSWRDPNETDEQYESSKCGNGFVCWILKKYKDKDGNILDKWEPLKNGLLSDKYVAINLKKVMKPIEDANISDIKKIIRSSDINGTSSGFVELKYEIRDCEVLNNNIFTDEEKNILNIMNIYDTYVSVPKIKLFLHVTNSYLGTHSLRITTRYLFTPSEESGITKMVYLPTLLLSQSLKLDHKKTEIFDIPRFPTDLETSFIEKINILRNEKIQDHEDLINIISSMMSSKDKHDMWKSLLLNPNLNVWTVLNFTYLSISKSTIEVLKADNKIIDKYISKLFI